MGNTKIFPEKYQRMSILGAMLVFFGVFCTGCGGSGGSTPSPTPIPEQKYEWPMFGLDYEHSRHSPDVSFNRSNIGRLSVAFRLPGAGVTGTPTIVDDRVYYSDYDGWVNVIDAESGELHWRVQLQESMLTPSVLVSDDTLYIAGKDSIVYALDREDGSVRWQSAIENTSFNQIWSSPIVIDNTLIIGAASFQGTRVISEDEEFFRGGIVGLNATTGEQLWRLSVCPEESCGGGVSVWSSASIDTDLKIAYIGTGQAHRSPAGPYSDSLVAFDYETGEMLWHHQYTANDVFSVDGGALDFDIGASPNLFSAMVSEVERDLVGVADKGGRYMAFDRVSGEKVWETYLGFGSFLGGAMGSAAYADGRLYLTCNTSFYIGERTEFVPSSADALALDASTGNIVWRRSFGAGVIGGALVANELMYFTTWDGQLRVLDTLSGAVLRTIPVGDGVGVYDVTLGGFPNGSSSGPSIYNGRIYIGYGWSWFSSISGGLSVLEI